MGLPARGEASGVDAQRAWAEAEGTSAIDHVADGRVAGYQEGLRALWVIFIPRSSACHIFLSFFTVVQRYTIRRRFRHIIMDIKDLGACSVPMPSSYCGALCTLANPAL